jgi:hypothetical protein
VTRTVATDTSTLARELVSRLAAIVPPGISVVTDGASIDVASARSRVSVDFRSIVEQAGEEDANAELGARAVLDAVQDFVAEELTRPWPEGAASLPLPAAAVERGSLRLWYGDELHPALELPPIPLRAE